MIECKVKGYTVIMEIKINAGTTTEAIKKAMTWIEPMNCPVRLIRIFNGKEVEKFYEQIGVR